MPVIVDLVELPISGRHEKTTKKDNWAIAESNKNDFIVTTQLFGGVEKRKRKLQKFELQMIQSLMWN